MRGAATIAQPATGGSTRTVSRNHFMYERHLPFHGTALSSKFGGFEMLALACFERITAVPLLIETVDLVNMEPQLKSVNQDGS